MPSPVTHTSNQLTVMILLSMRQTPTTVKQHFAKDSPYIAQIRVSTLLPSQQENLHLQELRDHAEQDQAYQALKLVIAEGFPSIKASLPDSLKRFWSIKDHLSIDDDLIVYGCHLLIPTSLHASMLSRLHDAHQEIARSQARARHTIYWPGIDQDIEAYIQGCHHCQDRLPSNAKEPMVSKQILDRPFQQVAAHFASYGSKQFLIIVDCKSDWPDIIEMGKDTTAAKLPTTMRDYFCRTAAAGCWEIGDCINNVIADGVPFRG